jgi:hypothetical protein
MKRCFCAILLVLFLAVPALAAKYDLDNFQNLANDEFRTLVREVGAATAYRALAPAEPQGLTGFDVGVAVTVVDIDDEWEAVFEDLDAPGYLPVPSLRLRKGLPFNVDIGAFYAQAPRTNLRMYGGEVQWALLEGGVASPALALRGSYSTLKGVDDLDLETYAADAVISKGFAMLTPYAGIGMVRIEGDYTGDFNPGLDRHKLEEVRYFGGMQVALALLRLTVEAEYLEKPVYSAKISLGW